MSFNDKDRMTQNITTKNFNHTYVCFLDILGFKDLVENNKPSKLTKIYKDLLQNTVDTTTDFWKEKDLEKLTGGVKLNSLVISDSIIIWTSDPTPLAFIKLLVSVHSIMFQTMHYGIPLRGGLSAGQLTVLKSTNNTTVFGKGLVNAYKLESHQDWSGCIVDEECIDAFKYFTKGRRTKKRPLKLADIYFLKQYPAPMKSGKMEVRWVIDWTKFMNLEDDGTQKGLFIYDESVVNAFSCHKKNTNDWRVHSIIRNTLDFWAYAMNIEGAKLEELPKDKAKLQRVVKKIFHRKVKK